MINISINDIISVNKYDCFEIPVCLNVGTSSNPCIYELSIGDYIQFNLREIKDESGRKLITKTILCVDKNNKVPVCNPKDGKYAQFHGDGYYDEKIKEPVFLFNSDDTKNLLPGTYYYDVILFRKLDKEGREKFNQNYMVTTLHNNKLFYVLT